MTVSGIKLPVSSMLPEPYFKFENGKEHFIYIW